MCEGNEAWKNLFALGMSQVRGQEIESHLGALVLGITRTAFCHFVANPEGALELFPQG